MSFYKRKEVIGDATLYLGDCLDIVNFLEDNINVVISSPPYAKQRDYEGREFNWNEIMSIFYRISGTEDIQYLINLGLFYREGECVEYWRDWVDKMKSEGLRFFGWYVWDKQYGLPGNWNGRLAPAHEFIFHFNKKAKKLNKVFVCRRAGEDTTKGSTGMRQKNGKMTGWNHRGKVTQDFKIGDSVIRRHRHMTRGIEVEHPAVFSISFVSELIASFSSEEEIVLDPFMGSGSTGVACMDLGRKFLGIEIEEKYFDIACKRIETAQRQMKLF